MNPKQPKIAPLKPLLITAVVLLCLVAIAGSVFHYERQMLNSCNRTAIDSVAHAYKVFPDTPKDTVLAWLDRDYELRSPLMWRLHTRYFGFDTITPGYYRFESTIGDREIIRRLTYGHQSDYKLTLSHSIRTPEQLAARLGKALLLDSADIAVRLDSVEYLAQYGLGPTTATCLFLPNTYFVRWTITPDDLFARMADEYNRFWNDERRAQAEALHLSPTQVQTLASIVNSETFRAGEWHNIASLYLNRLNKGMRLQADPTVVYANQIFGSRRVLRKHLTCDSPYNTYRYAGLPPGPIRCALPACVDSVLTAPKTKYLYMCANPDFSGTHVFTSTYDQHLRVARQYQHELNRRKIRK